jgi:lysyl-tRNA synthetase class 2
VAAEGRLGRTKTGELTLWTDRFSILSKAVRPPPEKWHGLTDVEARYRRRYVDLFANPESRDIFVTRARIIAHVRKVLAERNFIEVETPVLQPIYGGAAARPFMTHHNTLDMDLYLRISPELYLKRCLVGGLERVYEFARCFRNEGISPRHNPEFTMLELYQAYGDYHDMMDITEAIIAGAARDVIGSTKIQFGDREIDYATPWPRRRYADLVREYAGVDIDDHAAVLQKARDIGLLGKIERAAAAAVAATAAATATATAAPTADNRPPSQGGLQGGTGSAGASASTLPQPLPEREGSAGPVQIDHVLLVNALFEETVEHNLINPTFVIDYPAPLCPLTRRDPHDPRYALRFEVFLNGMEMGNAYSELNDPEIQRENLTAQVEGEGDETMRVMDDDFVEALEHAMPPAGGLGIGIDRLVMLLTGSQSIRDVLLFPLQRPQA